MMPSIVDTITFSSHNVIPVVIQDYDTGEVLMLGYMNPEALEKTSESGKTHLYGRREKDLKPYGEETGNIQHVQSIHLSKKGDSILIRATLGSPPPRSTYNRRWCPQTSSWVEEGERGFVPPAV